MSIVRTLKDAFTSESKAVYRCDACGGTFDTDPDADASCPECGSDEVRLVNRL
jgi:rubrerythrin